MISSRASGPPKQVWIPLPNPRCSLSVRIGSKRSGSGNRRGSRLAAPHTRNTADPAGIRVPAISMSAVAHRLGKNCTEPCSRCTSSTVRGIRSGLAASRSHEPGLRSSVITQLVMVFTVESCPAISSSSALDSATSLDTGPSGPSSCSAAESRPGPGSRASRSTRSCTQTPSSVMLAAALAVAARPASVSASGPTSAPCMKSITQPWNFGSSSTGAPITWKITDTGIG